MTETEKEQLLIWIDTHIDKLQKISDLLQGLKHPENCPGRIAVSFWDGKINIHIKDMKQLHNTRRYLREEFDTWEDKMGLIWWSYGANVSWRGKIDDIEVQIWLSCPVEDFPEELQKDGCGFKSTRVTEYDYVCNKEKE